MLLCVCVFVVVCFRFLPFLLNLFVALMKKQVLFIFICYESTKK